MVWLNCHGRGKNKRICDKRFEKQQLYGLKHWPWGDAFTDSPCIPGWP